jgi:DNA-binding response OmpR family regulator
MHIPNGVASSVLIADDDEDICALVATILTRAGFHASTVDGGVPALAAARRERAQLYVLDVRMPDMNGLDVCRELKASGATNAPVLLISAESSHDDVAAGYAAGCDDYLPKPFSASELIRRVDHLLSRHPDR